MNTPRANHAARAPFQVLVLPFLKEANASIRYCLFRRSDAPYWQGIAGGGEGDESLSAAARREAWEEAGIAPATPLFCLETKTSIPVVNIGGFLWGKDVLLVTEHCFAQKVASSSIILSPEHTEYRWLEYEDAHALLKWDSNKAALWELNHRLTRLPDTLVEVASGPDANR